jgi:hypothetical protein
MRLWVAEPTPMKLTALRVLATVWKCLQSRGMEIADVGEARAISSR